MPLSCLISVSTWREGTVVVIAEQIKLKMKNRLHDFSPDLRGQIYILLWSPSTKLNISGVSSVPLAMDRVRELCRQRVLGNTGVVAPLRLRL
jgi:hypothetical protein